MTKVIFKREKDHVLAVFPQEAGTNSYHQTCMCYAHSGQHAACDVNYTANLPPATQEAYAPLLKELQTIGYDDLRIMKRFNRWADMQARRDQVRI